MAARVWKGQLSFGLVSFPVSLAAAARPETIHFHMLHRKDNSRIKEVWYCAKENKPVDRDEIAKGYEYSKGKYVIVEDAELKKVAPPTATSMEILQFVHAGEVDPLYFEKSWYIASDPAAAKPYALLWKAMEETGHYGVARIAMHSREHIAIIRPSETGLVLHTMYFVNELHKFKAPKMEAKAKSTAKELALAKRLIDALAAPFQPEQFHDEYRKNVERLIEQKRHGRKPAVVEQPEKRNVVDIFDALKRSLEKPAAKQTGTKKRTKAHPGKAA